MFDYIAFCQRFVQEALCVDYLEELRWQGGPVCPFCGAPQVYICNSRRIFKCPGCMRQFTARTGTIFEQSHVPLRKWFIALYLLTTHDRIASSIQIGKRLDITQKSAWRMLRLIRSVAGDGDGETSGPPRGLDATFDEALQKIIRAAKPREDGTTFA